MAGVDIAAKGKKRSQNAEINMIPFIDLLFMMLAFLLVTAVWTANSRLQANAQVPDNPDAPVEPVAESKVLHVHVGVEEFTLVWKHGATVLSEVKVPKEKGSSDHVSYPELAKRIRAEWERTGEHKDTADQKVDNVVLHSDNRTPYKELAAVMDAVSGTKREMKVGNAVAMVPAMNLTFSVK
ncbi:MAG: biopolymer transporter [Polyangiaceae bacterium]|nr:biopolymer transporter [Polyangiaceae bacterium]